MPGNFCKGPPNSKMNATCAAKHIFQSAKTAAKSFIYLKLVSRNIEFLSSWMVSCFLYDQLINHIMKPRVASIC